MPKTADLKAPLKMRHLSFYAFHLTPTTGEFLLTSKRVRNSIRRRPSPDFSSGTKPLGQVMGLWFPYLHEEGVGQKPLTRLSLSPSSCALGRGVLADSERASQLLTPSLAGAAWG